MSNIINASHTANKLIEDKFMTSAPLSRPGTAAAKQGKQLAAVATAAIPVVVLSSLAMAQPAEAAPAAKNSTSTHTTGSLAKALASAKLAGTKASPAISSAVVAGTLPSRIAPAAPKAATTHKVVSGDTVYGIALKYGVSTKSLMSLNKIPASALIYPGQVLKLKGAVSQVSAPKAATSSAAKAASSAVKTTATSNYVVKSGDTVSGIAARHGLSLSSVLSANGMSMTRNTIYPGQVLKLRAGATAAAPKATSTQTTAKKPAATQTASKGSYIIKSGDTLSGIAAKHGVSLSALAKANGLSINGIIYPGKKLSIPGVSAASSQVTPIAPSSNNTQALVPSTFLHYTYPAAVVADANKNKAALLAAPVPSRAQMQTMIRNTARQMGVDPALALAFALQESSFDHRSVSPANAIGTMQVIPQAGEWASDLVGRKLNLLNPQDNVTAGVAIIRQLVRDAPNQDIAIAGYYQGQYSVKLYGMYPDTRTYVAGIKAKRAQFL